MLVGKVSVATIAALFERHGARLLERNIRRYLLHHDPRKVSELPLPPPHPEQLIAWIRQLYPSQSDAPRRPGSAAHTARV